MHGEGVTIQRKDLALARGLSVGKFLKGWIDGILAADKGTMVHVIVISRISNTYGRLRLEKTRKGDGVGLRYGDQKSKLRCCW